MFDKTHRFLVARSQPENIALSLLLVAIIGAVDYLTGIEISVSIFYLLPIVLITWYGRAVAGYLLCIVSSAVWLALDFAARETFSHFLIPFWNASVRLGFFVTTAYLLNDLKRHLLREQSLASIDDLTGLYNGRVFREQTCNLLQLSKRHQHAFALAYIDVDNFKFVNDSFGHSEGDRFLRAVGETMRRTLRTTDIVGRLGGDEFAVALPETGFDAAKVTLTKLREVLTETAELTQWPVSFSIGVAVFTLTPQSYDEAINLADGIMYRVKSSGKDCILFEEFGATTIAS